jgi:membrane-bound lytic murein transglycosylase C
MNRSIKYSLKRRQFLSRLALLPLSFSAVNVFSDSFDDFVKSQQAGADKIKSDFQTYQEHYLDAFEQHKRTLEKEWQSVEISNQDIWVEYSKDLQKKTVVDFVHNEIRLSYKSSGNFDPKQPIPPAELSQDLEALVNLTEYQAIINDPIYTLLKQDIKASTKTNDRILLSELHELYGNENAAKMLEQTAQISDGNTAKGHVIKVTISLPKQFPFKRAEKYYASAQKAAKQWNIDAALVMAITHTESHFNPLARSHIPAFGLMQIVPASAGKDASKFMTGKSRILTSTELYDANFNLATGSAYLSMLQTHYLKGITDPTSRLYCTIAAYNTGTGNVAKAFIGYASMQQAFQVINQLNSEQVYKALKHDLPYAETRRYLVKVMGHLERYQQVV